MIKDREALGTQGLPLSYLLATSENSLADETAARSLALIYKHFSNGSCYACEFLIELPDKLLAARSAIASLERPF